MNKIQSNYSKTCGMSFRSYFVFLILVLSCSPRGNNVDQDQYQGLHSDASFRIFFKDFASDSIFQAKRIEFPLSYVQYEDDSVPSQTQIKKEEWVFEDFSDDSLGRFRHEDAFEVVIDEKDSTNVEYSLKGIDNGILIIYDFKRRRDGWYLTKMTDLSN